MLAEHLWGWRGWCLLAVMCLGTSVGCKDNTTNPTSDCRVAYELIEGEPSPRFDLIFVSPDERVVTRTVHDTGDAPTRAIYYYFDDDGRLSVEAMDTDLDGELDARLDAGDVLGEFVTPYTVDALIEDDKLDGVQFSVDLPSSNIGPWSPARLYYQAACDQGEFTAERINDERLNVHLDADNDGEPDGKLDVQYGADGRLLRWTVDNDGDTFADHISNISYDDDGRVTEVFWTEPNELLGDVYILGRYRYDAYGMLYAYELDAEGDGTIDHRITYSAGCFDYPEGT